MLREDAEASTTRAATPANGRTDPDAGDLRLAVGSADESVRREAASRLLARYQDHVYAWCIRFVRDHERALDLSQDVLLSAYQNLHRFQPKAKFSTWLFVIARNRCVSEMRKAPAKEVFGVDLDLVADEGPDPETALLHEEGRDRLLDLMREHLDPVEQEVLSLRCFEHLPVDSITSMMGISEASGARGVLQRVRRKLRSALAKDEES